MFHACDLGEVDTCNDDTRFFGALGWVCEPCYTWLRDTPVEDM